MDNFVHQCVYPCMHLGGYDITRYSEPYVRPIQADYCSCKHLLVRAPMGSGKTTRIVQTLLAHPPQSALIITPRQLFAASMLGTLASVMPDLQLYKRVPHEDRHLHDFMICQVESLWTLAPRTQYDLVILDECESVLSQFTAPTVRHFDAISTAFQQIIAQATRCIWTDAFLQDRSLATCTALDPSATRRFIWNEFVPSGRVAISLGTQRPGKEALADKAADLASESNVCVCASREIAESLHADLVRSGPALLITAATPDDVKMRLSDVNTLLIPYRHFIYTSALTVGVNFDTRDHFDNLFVYTSTYSNCVRDSIQSSMRVRHIKSGRLFYASTDRYYGTDRPRVYSRLDLRRAIEGRRPYSPRDDDTLYPRRAELLPWQKQLWVFNQQEANVSTFLHPHLLKAYLQLCGYS